MTEDEKTIYQKREVFLKSLEKQMREMVYIYEAMTGDRVTEIDVVIPHDVNLKTGKIETFPLSLRARVEPIL